MRCIALSAFTSVAVVAAAQSTPRTLLWRITSDPLATSSYLFGTVHSKDDRAFQWGDSLLPALERVDLVAGELDLEESASQLLSVIPMALMPDGRTLQSLYRKRDWKHVEAVLRQELGPMFGLVTRVKPFFVILLISGSEVDGSHERVLDEEIMHRAREHGKEVTGLETMREQMEALDVLPLDEQARLLLEFVHEGDLEKEMDAMLEAYAAQDLDALMKVLEGSPTMPAEMDVSLIVERNQRMAHRMDSILTTGTSAFFAVGAGHLPRGSGLIALLRARGYLVEPVISPYTAPSPFLKEEEGR